MENDERPFDVLASGERALLRRRVPADVELWLRWRASGEWRHYDAPWEQEPVADEAGFRARFQAKLAEEAQRPPTRATLCTRAGVPVGFVSRYADPRFDAALHVGLAICEDEHLERGLGSEALRLWVDYLFAHTAVHRIGLATWSLNPRMLHVAAKLGFRAEGVERELVEWQGAWHDRHLFGVLRREWDAAQ